MIDITEVHLRQIDVAADVFGDRNISWQSAWVGRIVVDRVDGDRHRFGCGVRSIGSIHGENDLVITDTASSTESAVNDELWVPNLTDATSSTVATSTQL